MTRVSSSASGEANVLMHEYYNSFAEGGFGLIITEGLFTDNLLSQGYQYQPGICTKQQALSWEPIIKDLHKKNCAVIAQLMHAGALSQFNPHQNESIAPSAIQPLGKQLTFYYGQNEFSLPRCMTQKDINLVIQGFTQSALMAKEAGFDGVEIHGANGYLLDQFLTDYTNQRQDCYGGTLKNRLRIFGKLSKSIRKAVGNDFIVGIRISQKKVNDACYSWPNRKIDAKTIFEYLGQCPLDYIHTTEPLLNHPAFGHGETLAKLAKLFSGLPIIANGGVEQPYQAEDMIKNNQADLISLGRSALMNRNWPSHIENPSCIKIFDPKILMPIANLTNENLYRANHEQI